MKNGSGNITFYGSSVVSGLQNLVVNGGTVRTDPWALWKSDLNLTVNGSGVFEMWNTTTSIGNLSGNGTIKNSANYSGYSGGATYATNNLTIAAGNFSGTITDNGIGDGTTTSGPSGDTRINLIKSGTGTTLTLSGNNTYRGSTTVSAGTLLATKAAALPGYNAASKVSVASGATLAVRAGGAGEWSSGEIDSVLGATTNAFASSSNLGIDVTTGNSFSYANDIGATQTAKGLVKSGAGTLTLTGTNTYTGTTRINGGDTHYRRGRSHPWRRCCDRGKRSHLALGSVLGHRWLLRRRANRCDHGECRRDAYGHGRCERHHQRTDPQWRHRERCRDNKQRLGCVQHRLQCVCWAIGCFHIDHLCGAGRFEHSDFRSRHRQHAQYQRGHAQQV